MDASGGVPQKGMMSYISIMLIDVSMIPKLYLAYTINSCTILYCMLTRNPGWMPQEGCSEGDDVIYEYNVN